MNYDSVLKAEHQKYFSMTPRMAECVPLAMAEHGCVFNSESSSRF
jgi:hypothetical protein